MAYFMSRREEHIAMAVYAQESAEPPPSPQRSSQPRAPTSPKQVGYRRTTAHTLCHNPQTLCVSAREAQIARLAYGEDEEPGGAEGASAEDRAPHPPRPPREGRPHYISMGRGRVIEIHPEGTPRATRSPLRGELSTASVPHSLAEASLQSTSLPASPRGELGALLQPAWRTSPPRRNKLHFPQRPDLPIEELPGGANLSFGLSGRTDMCSASIFDDRRPLAAPLPAPCRGVPREQGSWSEDWTFENSAPLRFRLGRQALLPVHLARDASACSTRSHETAVTEGTQRSSRLSEGHPLKSSQRSLPPPTGEPAAGGATKSDSVASLKEVPEAPAAEQSDATAHSREPASPAAGKTEAKEPAAAAAGASSPKGEPAPAANAPPPAASTTRSPGASQSVVLPVVKSICMVPAEGVLTQRRRDCAGW